MGTDLVAPTAGVSRASAPTETSLMSSLVTLYNKLRGAGGADADITANLQTLLTGTYQGLLTPVVGEWFEGPIATTSTYAQPNGELMWRPFWVPRAMTLDRLGCEVTVGGGANAVTRLALASDDGTGKPGALLVDGGTAVTTGTGDKNVTINQAVPAGLHWLGAVNQGAAAPPATLRLVGSDGLQFIYSAQPGTRVGLGWIETGVTGAVPSARGTLARNNTPIRVTARRSA
jgi:hypothetical protein